MEFCRSDNLFGVSWVKLDLAEQFKPLEAIPQLAKPPLKGGDFFL
jgi:hypothetical protein